IVRIVRGDTAISTNILITKTVIIKLTKTDAGIVPAKAIVLNIIVSNKFPTAEELINRLHKFFPRLAYFILASTYEFTNSPTNIAIVLANTIRQTTPNIESYAAWWVQSCAGVNIPTS